MLETILIVTYFKLWNIMNALDKNNNNNNDFLFDTKKKRRYIISFMKHSHRVKVYWHVYTFFLVI